MQETTFKRKKILLIAQFGTFGGARTYFEELLNFYADHHYKVFVCLSRDHNDNPVNDLIKDMGFTILQIGRRWQGVFNCWNWPVISFIMDILIVLRAYIKVRPDSIMVSNISPDEFLGLAFLPGRFIYVIHSYPLEDHTESGIIKFLKRIRKIALNKKFNNPKKKMITVSSFSKNQIMKLWGLSEEKISIVYNFGGYEAGVEVKTKIQDNFIVLTFGHVVDYKNPLIWIKVAKIVVKHFANLNVEFLWAGEGELISICRNQVADDGLADKIRFIGLVKETDQYYTRASIYFQPSRMESHGIAVVEAMKNSLPCVVSDAGGLPESVKHEVNGFVLEPDDIDGMARAIILLIEKSSLRKEMGKESFSIYTEKFTFEIWKRKMELLHQIQTQ
jgi:glycosyltransferase involved in cell wall biosynthesis